MRHVAQPTAERRGKRTARPEAERDTRAAVEARATARDGASVRDRAMRLSPLLVLIAAVVLVILGQLAEDLADSEPLQLLTPLDAKGRWTLIVAVVYMLVIGRIIERMVTRSLATLDALVDVDQERFRDYM